MVTTTGQSLESKTLSAPPMHIPNGKGGCYKTELVVERTTESVTKINWWHEPDPRRDPHSHPWLDRDGFEFVATVEQGQYTETRWQFHYGVWVKTHHTYRAGDVNRMPKGVFHTVDEVAPGTRTRMVCGALVQDGVWGYLDLETYRFIRAMPDPEFIVALRLLNPHLRPK